MTTSKRFAGFDIEIAKEIPEGCPNWNTIRPLGISCAAVCLSDSQFPKVYYHGTAVENVYLPEAGAMTMLEVQSLVADLMKLEEDGYTICTWNGLGFDFNVLAEESGQHNQCVALALRHLDMAFHVFCEKGYMPGLDAVAKGMRLPGKTEGMHGDMAPKLWAGSVEDRYKVLEYVTQDARTTVDLAVMSDKLGYISWTARSGRGMLYKTGGWRTVVNACLFPVPDTSWMDKPRLREEYLEWTVKNANGK